MSFNPKMIPSTLENQMSNMASVTVGQFSPVSVTGQPVVSTVSTTISPKDNNIRVLSYNICWEAMSGIKLKKSSLELCDNEKYPNDYERCQNNVIDLIINTQPLDFIAIQETGGPADQKDVPKGTEQTFSTRIENYEKELPDMTKIRSKFGEKMDTCYNNKKYNLLYTFIGNLPNYIEKPKNREKPNEVIPPTVFITYGYHIRTPGVIEPKIMQIAPPTKEIYEGIRTQENPKGTGRPYQMLIFNEGIIFINMHAGHFSQIYTIFQHIETFILSVIPPEFNKFRIIIAGDFNNALPTFMKNYHIGGKNFYMSTNLMTFPTKKGYFDHVLDTQGPINIEVLHPQIPASDHLPILATLQPLP
jgi:hypothetical protein